MSKATESVDIGAGDPSRDIVRQVLAESWGAQAEPVPLGSVQDSVYWVLDHSGGPLGAVRVSTGAVDEEDVEAEARRLAHLAEVIPELTCRPCVGEPMAAGSRRCPEHAERRAAHSKCCSGTTARPRA